MTAADARRIWERRRAARDLDALLDVHRPARVPSTFGLDVAELAAERDRLAAEVWSPGEVRRVLDLRGVA